MPAVNRKPLHQTRGNVFSDLGFSGEEAAILALKTQLHVEVMKVVRRQRRTPSQLMKILKVPQSRVRELMTGRISGVSIDLFTKYLHRLGREVQISTKSETKRAAATT